MDSVLRQDPIGLHPLPTEANRLPGKSHLAAQSLVRKKGVGDESGEDTEVGPIHRATDWEGRY